MLKFLSRHRYKIAVGLVILLSPLVFLERVKAKLGAESQKVVEIVDIYSADQSLAGTNGEKMTQFHLQGEEMATGLLMAAADKRGDFKARDQLFLDGVKVGTNRSLYFLMSNNAFLFSEKARQEQQQELDSATSEEIKQFRLKQQVSTIPAEDQQQLEACFDLLNGRYQGVLHQVVEMKDFVYDTRSCDFSNSLHLTTKE